MNLPDQPSAPPEEPVRGAQDQASALAELGRYAAALGDGAEQVLGEWVRGCVRSRLLQWSGEVPAGAEAAAEEAARQATADVVPRLRALLAQDVDAQRSTPLSVLRGAVPHPTAVLAAAGVPGVVRDEVAERAFPDDVYDLSPRSFADVHPSLAEPGLHWGAAKAFVVLQRRRPAPPS